MDRAIVYNAEELIETDILNGDKFAMIGVAKLAEMALGTGPLASGFACSPGTGLNIAIAAGQFYQQAQVDATAFSTLGTDSHTIVKQGLLMDPVTLSVPAPGTAGQSINYLVEVTYQDVDTGSTLVPFYNASNPSVPYLGPGNSGNPSYTIRAGRATVQVKAGTAAATGTQTTPAADAGYSPLWVVTVANGQASITTGNISLAAGAPFITTNLGSLLQVYAGNPNGNVAGNAGVAGQSAPSLVWDITHNVMWACTTSGTAGTAVWTQFGGSAINGAAVWCGTSTGTASTEVLATPISLVSFPTGTAVAWKIGAGLTNTGAVNVTVGSFGTFAVQKDSPTGPIALTGGELVAGNLATARFDGTVLQLVATELGTAALENASSNTGMVAAVSGSGGLVPGHMAVFLDTAGTVADGGAPGAAVVSYINVSNNGNTLGAGVYMVDTSGGAFTINLPPAPTQGLTMEFRDATGTWTPNNFTINRNGKTIMGSSENLICNVAGEDVVIWFNGSDWRLF